MSDDPSPHRDPAASAPLSELVAVNVAGDIEAVADELDRAAESMFALYVDNRLVIDHAKVAARLRRIAAGIREGQS